MHSRARPHGVCSPVSGCRSGSLVTNHSVGATGGIIGQSIPSSPLRPSPTKRSTRQHGRTPIANEHRRSAPCVTSIAGGWLGSLTAWVYHVLFFGIKWRVPKGISQGYASFSHTYHTCLIPAGS